MGKGSKWRETDYKKYFDNWNKIKKTAEVKYKSEEKKKGKTTYKYN